MPFGFHLAMDTLPSGNRKRWLQVRPGCVRLSPSCPFRLIHTFLSPGPRGITPAFGYGAPHSSARGTSTLLNSALLSAHYAAVRLPAAVHVGLMAHRFLPPFRRLAATDSNRVSPRPLKGTVGSVLAREVSLHALGLRLRSAGDTLAIARAPVLPSGCLDTVGATDCGYFGAHQLQGYPGLHC